jgi:hypothetical protein
LLESSVAWIDFAEEDRRRMTEVISLFSERDTRDELGLRSVRDDIALHSYIISQTPFEKLSGQTGIARRRVFNRDYHVYFREQDGYVAALLEEVLVGTSG